MKIQPWKVVGDSANFTVLGVDEEGKVHYWKDQKWNLL